jgi:hypothetical protein
MKIEPGLVIVIIAVLAFYLRLIGLQREQVKRLSQAPVSKQKAKGKVKQVDFSRRFSIISQGFNDRVIAGMGLVFILVGILLNSRVIPLIKVQPYWWIPTTVGILAFSWLFKLEKQ